MTTKKLNQKELLKRHREKCRLHVELEEFQSLTFGLTTAQINELTGYHPTTIRKWFAGSASVPFVVAQFFRVRSRGVIGKHWENWHFGSDGLLYHPQWRRGFDGYELAAMFWGCQIKNTLQSDINVLKSEIERLSAKLDNAESQVFFYRSQVRLEAKLGLALTRIAA